MVFSQDIPSQSLGFIDSQASTLEITVAGHDLTIHQSRGLLTSDRKEGTTGAGRCGFCLFVFLVCIDSIYSYLGPRRLARSQAKGTPLMSYAYDLFWSYMHCMRMVRGSASYDNGSLVSTSKSTPIIHKPCL